MAAKIEIQTTVVQIFEITVNRRKVVLELEPTPGIPAGAKSRLVLSGNTIGYSVTHPETGTEHSTVITAHYADDHSPYYPDERDMKVFFDAVVFLLGKENLHYSDHTAIDHAYTTICQTHSVKFE